MNNAPVTFLFDFDTLDDKTRAYIMNEFAANGAKHLVLSDTLLRKIVGNLKFKDMMMEEMKAAGLTFMDSHAIFGKYLDLNCPIPEARPEMLLRHKLQLQIIHSMGVNTITIHIGNENAYPEYTLEQQTDAIKSSLDELLPMAEDLGITICIENIWSRINTPDNLWNIKNAFPTDALGFCYDAGHAHLMDKGRFNPDSNPHHSWVGMEPQWDDKILEKMLPHVVNCHIHDNNGVTDQHLNIGSGNIDWNHISTLLKQAPRLQVIQSEVIPMRANAAIKDICNNFRQYFDI